MAATETVQQELGYIAPNFNLPDTNDNMQVKTLHDVKGSKATVVMFICNHCPFVKHINQELVNIANDYQDKGVKFVAISSNDVVNYPEDSPEKMAETAAEHQYPFPYLYDETQHVAKSYVAACTPDFSVFDADLKAVYRGQLDDSRPGNNKPVTGKDLRNALDNIIEGKAPSEKQIPSIGCNIKWKNGEFPY